MQKQTSTHSRPIEQVTADFNSCSLRPRFRAVLPNMSGVISSSWRESLVIWGKMTPPSGPGYSK